MMVQLQNNTLHNYIIDRHLCTLIEKGIDLREYMDCELSIVQIKDPSFPTNHWDDSFMIMAANYDSPYEVIKNYD